MTDETKKPRDKIAIFSLVVSIFAMLGTVGSNFYRDQQAETAKQQLKLAQEQFKTAEERYESTEKQRKIDNDRGNHTQFLAALQALSDGQSKFAEAAVLYKDTQIIGTVQSEVTTQLLMLLLQAEILLPDMKRINVVSDAEYLVLAKHSLHQGFYPKTEIYCAEAAKSDNPKVLGSVKVVLGSLAYKRADNDGAIKRFEEAMEIYTSSKTLLEGEKALEKVQTCVMWSSLETDYGDQSYKKAEEIIANGERYVEKLRPGSLKDSAVSFFEEQRKEIAKRRNPTIKPTP